MNSRRNENREWTADLGAWARHGLYDFSTVASSCCTGPGWACSRTGTAPSGTGSTPATRFSPSTGHPGSPPPHSTGGFPGNSPGKRSPETSAFTSWPLPAGSSWTTAVSVQYMAHHWIHQEILSNKHPAKCNRSIFIYVFQFDFECTMYTSDDARSKMRADPDGWRFPRAPFSRELLPLVLTCYPVKYI